MVDQRRTVLADAAIEVLAGRGMRGLTHRAVDEEAGVAQGSTSYYFRTRQALLQAALDRLAERTRADFEAADPADGGGPAGTGEAAAEELAGLIVGIAVRWLGEERSRLLARYELALEGTRRPELREVLAEDDARIVGMVTERLRAYGAPDAERSGPLLVAWLDGMLFRRSTLLDGVEADTDVRLREDVARLLAAFGMR